MIVSQIAAMARNRVIGVANKLPWNIPEDLKYFRARTAGHICVMGRKTFESIGSKPLPKRLNIVVTRRTDFSAVEGVVVVSSVTEALGAAQATRAREPDRWPDEIFIVGGGEIYRAALSVTDRIYLTEIAMDAVGDAHFPELPAGEFAEVQRDARMQESEAGPLKFDFVIYERV